MLQNSRLLPAVLGLIASIGWGSTSTEVLPTTIASAGEMRLEASQTITGVNTCLKATQHACITDQTTWQRVWLSHAGLIDASAAESRPTVDFSRSVVIAIVEKPDSETTSGIRVSITLSDDEVAWIGYEQYHDSNRNKRRRPENVYGFLVIPRGQHEIVLQRSPASQHGEGLHEQMTEVARFPAMQSHQAAESLPRHYGLTGRMLNIGFAHDPGAGNYDGVIGSPNDLWNLVSMGTTAKDFMRYSDTTASTARMRISRHDGAWGIEGQHGIFRGYIYDNCRCVDLESTILDLPAGRYRAYVYAHGDAPNQNARIELKVGNESIGQKATANEGSWKFRSQPFTEGVQYVTFEFATKTGDAITFISHRDGSDLSMFNAIQIVPIDHFASSDLSDTTGHAETTDK